TGLDDAVALLRGLGLHVSFDLLALFAGLLTDLGCFGAGFGELRVVLFKSGLGFSLCCFSTLNASLDPVLTLSQDLLELRKNPLPEDEQDDDERDDGPDDVVGLGEQD